MSVWKCFYWGGGHKILLHFLPKKHFYLWISENCEKWKKLFLVESLCRLDGNDFVWRIIVLEDETTFSHFFLHFGALVQFRHRI